MSAIAMEITLSEVKTCTVCASCEKSIFNIMWPALSWSWDLRRAYEVTVSVDSSEVILMESALLPFLRNLGRWRRTQCYTTNQMVLKLRE